jgi:2-methylisocitrate lyase-like PEP mutase family enzyme
MVGIKDKSFSVAELASAGVKRISLATSLYRAAMTGFLEAASEVKNSGRFRFLDRCVSTPELVKLMRIRHSRWATVRGRDLISTEPERGRRVLTPGM